LSLQQPFDHNDGGDGAYEWRGDANRRSTSSGSAIRVVITPKLTIVVAFHIKKPCFLVKTPIEDKVEISIELDFNFLTTFWRVDEQNNGEHHRALQRPSIWIRCSSGSCVVVALACEGMVLSDDVVLKVV